MQLIIILFILTFVITFAYAGLRGAPWVPTKSQDVERFLRLANIKPGQKVYDLGCGDGRMVCAATKKGAVAQGFEISLLPFLFANIRRFFQKERKKIKIYYKDFWNYNLGDADIIYFFLIHNYF